jgi:AcrR family transcriptional regulator
MTGIASPRLDRRAMKERTRERLLDAATAVFARRGFEGASLDEIAETAGYTKGAIYSNFASKTDLIVGLMQRRIVEQTAAAEAAFQGTTLDDGLRTLEARSVETGPGDRDWVVLAIEFWLLAMRDERARAAMAEEYEHARSITAAMLEAKYAEAGQAPPMPARDLAILIESVGVGVTLQSLLDPAAIPAGLQARAVAMLLSASPSNAASEPASRKA